MSTVITHLDITPCTFNATTWHCFAIQNYNNNNNNNIHTGPCPLLSFLVLQGCSALYTSCKCSAGVYLLQGLYHHQFIKLKGFSYGSRILVLFHFTWHSTWQCAHTNTKTFLRHICGSHSSYKSLHYIIKKCCIWQNHATQMPTHKGKAGDQDNGSIDQSTVHYMF